MTRECHVRFCERLRGKFPRPTHHFGMKAHIGTDSESGLVHSVVGTAANPTKAPQVREVLRGIQALHPRLERQAEPLQLTELTRCIDWLIEQEQVDSHALLHCRRDRALILLGFWRAFRSDDLCRLRVEFVQALSGEGMELFLPSSKGDRDNLGRSFSVPALKRLCPVEAYLDWIAISGLNHGPVFRAVDRWGNLAEAGLHAYSISRILRRVMVCSGLDGERFSSHSLRCGFATWASRNQWSTKALMSYVGWRDAKARGCPEFCVNGISVKPTTADLRTGW